MVRFNWSSLNMSTLGHGWDWAWGACMVSGGRLGWGGACRGVPVLREDGAMARLEGSPSEQV